LTTKKLISDDALATATRLPKDNLLVGLLSKVARIDEVNELYAHMCASPGLESIQTLFDKLDVDLDIDQQELENIPRSGPFVSEKPIPT